MYLATLDLKPKLEQFAVDARRTPKRVVHAHLPDQRTQPGLNRQPASQRSRLPAPIAAKARVVPVDERLGTDDGKYLKDRRKPAVKHDHDPAIRVRKPDATLKPAPQNSQLMPKYRVLSLKPHLRLDWRGQDSQDETQKPDHSTSGTHRVPVAIGENV